MQLTYNLVLCVAPPQKGTLPYVLNNPASKDPRTTSIRYGCNGKMSNWYLIDLDPRVFAVWKSIAIHLKMQMLQEPVYTEGREIGWRCYGERLRYYQILVIFMVVVAYVIPLVFIAGSYGYISRILTASIRTARQMSGGGAG